MNNYGDRKSTYKHKIRKRTEFNFWHTNCVKERKYVPLKNRQVFIKKH